MSVVSGSKKNCVMEEAGEERKRVECFAKAFSTFCLSVN